ncbi:conserved hypothetical protein [Theileria orientalis strain Shintoku]|uniref:Uncharacterized protein n=1 Tax=Theileria orientalis strain Shintoku TaxID=869250 RepID=J7MF70_THEOR|nr:conserved hypothetical protein [Theileria orientalis strain Shintoku]BAM42479.1 conserved hypothetical protein [Theileria orientalis strain Shintoku]|eukprot:XP_009692780.1 conserved hypothetical protein [Theileria orientalis strain Shintoku]
MYNKGLIRPYVIPRIVYIFILVYYFRYYVNSSPQPTIQKKPIGVDIGERESSDEFFYTEQDGNGYYRPKGNNVFDLIKIGGMLSTFTDKYDKVLWQSKDPNRYAKLVVIMKTDGSNYIYAVVMLDNGSFLLFNRAKVGHPWIDITASRHDVLRVKMIGLDPKDHTKAAEMDPSMYYLKTEFISYVIRFRKGAKCIEIQYMEKTVWTYKKKYPIKFLYNMRTNKAYVFYAEDNFKRLDL